MKVKVIILDFDGTIVESVGIKDQAFKSLFKDHPGHLNEVMEYHLTHDATVRFEKFKHIFENILGEEYNDDLEKRLGHRFSDIVFEEIVKCPYVAGSQDFLEYFFGRIPLYLVSISPADELDGILEARKLKKYFKKIYAVPWVKVGAIKDIMIKENVSHEEAVFVGDSFEDLRAAKESNVYFVGRDSGKSFNGEKVPIFKNLFEVRRHLSQENVFV